MIGGPLWHDATDPATLNECGSDRPLTADHGQPSLSQNWQFKAQLPGAPPPPRALFGFQVPQLAPLRAQDRLHLE
jgi:hypothetical protein